MSNDGVTCCGSRPTLNVSITLYVAWSITVTRVADRIRHVNTRREIFDYVRERVRPVGGVDVIGVEHRRHAGQRIRAAAAMDAAREPAGSEAKGRGPAPDDEQPASTAIPRNVRA